MKRITGVCFIILALFFASIAVPRIMKTVQLQKNAGRASGVVETVITQKETSATGRMRNVSRAIVSYTVMGEPHTARIVIASPISAQKGDKMLIYYDKNDPETILNVPVGWKQACILSLIMFLIGIAVFVWGGTD